MHEQIAPSGAAGHVVRILTVRADRPVAVLFCGPVQGMLTHRVQGRPYACIGEGSCPASVHKALTIWKGYAPVREWVAERQRWFPAVFQVTEALEELLHGRNLVGELWECIRLPDKRKVGAVTGVFIDRRDEAALLAPFDIRPPLQRLYHCNQLVLDVPNPVPPKLVLPAVEAAGPPSLSGPTPIPPTPVSPEQREAIRRLAGRYCPPERIGKNGY